MKFSAICKNFDGVNCEIVDDIIYLEEEYDEANAWETIDQTNSDDVFNDQVGDVATGFDEDQSRRTSNLLVFYINKQHSLS